MDTNRQDMVKATCGDDELLCGLYENLVVMVTEKFGTPDGTQRVRISDYVRLESIKGKLMADIENRGVGRTETNGRQRYWKDNKSIGLLLKYMSQQQSILKSFGFGGVEPDADADEDDDGFDDV